MSRLVAIDRPAGPGFVEELRRIWDAGDAAFPVDQRLPRPARDAVVAAMRVGDEVDEGDALVVATSGSTGAPRGVVLTHEAVAASADATSARLGVRDDDHWLACLPLSHVGGLSVVTRSLRTGTRLTVLERFDPEDATRSGATLVSLVATALRRIDPASFRVIVLGGSRPPTDQPPNAVTTYGMTETGSGVVYDGVPLDGVEVEITEPADGAVDGEIRLRGPMLLRCYRDGTVPTTPDGWFPTGDLGRFLPDGRLHVTGRRGDLIVSGGENVWPEAVEAALGDHPLVDDVMVRGVDDPEWGQVAEAVVVPRGRAPTLVELRTHVKRSHPAHLAPRRLVIARSLPRTALGKLRRHDDDRSA
ncbi:class I adenylate-forming enzyme family protein [Ilumatobacter sp.]|uniref:class I adenylate-forming enzyme family protein n=1 Tax=Ilumatobacter sp. TaxID=1967498 RepID=UPI003B52DF37